MSRRLRGLGQAIIVSVLAAVSCSAALGHDLTEAEVMERCRLAWESLETLQFTCSHFNVEGDRVAYDRGSTRSEFWQAPGGKRALVEWGVHPDREELMQNFRQDGRRRYTLICYPDHPEVVKDIGIEVQPDTADRYVGYMNFALWLLMPGGKPVHIHLAEGGRLAPYEGEGSGERVLVVSKFQGKPLRMVVDPERDWLPVEVAIEGGMRIVATRFEKDNGRWFPVDGGMVRPKTVIVSPNGEIKKYTGNELDVRQFEVSEFHINRPIPASRFELPRLEDGVRSLDVTKRKTRVEYQGGKSAYEERVRKYSDSTETSEERLTDPIIAGRPVSGLRNPVLLIGVGIAALLVAFGIRMRRTQDG